jgi:hypothetical protein
MNKLKLPDSIMSAIIEGYLFKISDIKGNVIINAQKSKT